MCCRIKWAKISHSVRNYFSITNTFRPQRKNFWKRKAEVFLFRECRAKVKGRFEINMQKVKVWILMTNLMKFVLKNARHRSTIAKMHASRRNCAATDGITVVIASTKTRTRVEWVIALFKVAWDILFCPT